MEESAPLSFRFLECRVNVYSLEDRYDSILDQNIICVNGKEIPSVLSRYSFMGTQTITEARERNDTD